MAVWDKKIVKTLKKYVGSVWMPVCLCGCPFVCVNRGLLFKWKGRTALLFLFFFYLKTHDPRQHWSDCTGGRAGMAQGGKPCARAAAQQPPLLRGEQVRRPTHRGWAV